MITKVEIFHTIQMYRVIPPNIKLSNDDYNVQQLRKRYNIPTKQAPKLLLKGDGDLKGSSVGHKTQNSLL